MTDQTGPGDDWLVAGGGDVRDIAGRYDSWAETYDADLEAWSYRAPVRVANSVMGRGPGARSALDVGCGTGLVGRALRARGFKGELTGVDLSESSLQVAERTGIYSRLLAADLQQPLPLRDGSFDVAVCVGVMTYLPDTDAVWRELARVVRTGGVVSLTMREDLWEPRDCAGVVKRLAAERIWTPLEVSGPEEYLPNAGGELGGLGAYYLTAEKC